VVFGEAATGKQTSLHTRDRREALRVFHAMRRSFGNLRKELTTDRSLRNPPTNRLKSLALLT
jgi:hypothetical protein